MTIHTGTYIPYEFEKRATLKYIIERCHGIKKSLKFIKMDTEHLEVRCPVAGDYLEITGTLDELNWLHGELTRQQWYKL